MKTTLTLVIIGVFAVSANRSQFENENQLMTTKWYQEMEKRIPNKDFAFCPIIEQITTAADYDLIVRLINWSTGKKVYSTSDSEYLPNLINGLRDTADDDFKVLQATKFYWNVSYELNPWYLVMFQYVYKGGDERLDFSNANAKNQINRWVSDNTNGFLQGFVTDIHHINQMLICTLYLSGKVCTNKKSYMQIDKWAHPFDPNRNEIKPFYGLNGTTKSEMMVNYGRDFNYRKTTIAQYIMLELQRSTLIIGLPLPYKTLQDLETSNELVAILKTFQLTQIDVILPKFTIKSVLPSYLTKISVIEQGLESASAINNMQVRNIYGYNMVSVRKNYLVSDAVLSLERNQFVADRPFMFYVIYKELVLFAGRIVNL